MKKNILTVLLGLCLIFAFTACGGGSGDTSQSANETSDSGSWELVGQVDEFGDEIAGSESVLRSSFTGDFSNTATSSSELSGFVLIAKQHGYYETYNVFFRLLEYNDTQATFFDSDEKYLDCKGGDGNIYRYQLTGESPNGDLTFVGNGDGKDFCSKLYDSTTDLRCIIKIGSSQYNFILKKDNFNELYDEMKGESSSSSVADAIDKVINGEPDQQREGLDFLQTNKDSFPEMSQEELKAIFPNTYLHISLSYKDGWCFGDHRSVTEYKKDGTTDQLLYYDESSGSWDNTAGKWPHEYSVKDGLFNDSTDTYKVRKICDGYYFGFEKKYDDSFSDEIEMLMVETNGNENPSKPIQ